jgi:hypothetical protein
VVLDEARDVEVALIQVVMDSRKRVPACGPPPVFRKYRKCIFTPVDQYSATFGGKPASTGSQILR